MFFLFSTTDQECKTGIANCKQNINLIIQNFKIKSYTQLIISRSTSLDIQEFLVEINNILSKLEDLRGMLLTHRHGLF